ncbi:Mitochondrial distribution and morphology protein 10 [Teratosphaeriaceae sp. CCFEE 6253]|nr:Mitochondrial distribution and morphology protein 10 [Teratosphaeriaceae sp. CCFEE 6253]
MLEFMDYVQAAFHAQSRWNCDNSYASLTTTAQHLLDFPIPSGLRLHVSSLSSPNFATSYTLGSHGVVDGSLSFLYSSLALSIPSRSSAVHLGNLVQGYRHLATLQRPAEQSLSEIIQDGQNLERRDALLYGRLYLPTSTLEALYVRRISPSRLLRLACVSDGTLPNGGSILAVLQNDFGKYSTEYLYSTDSALLGVRGLYNFGYDPRHPDQHSTSRPPAHPWDHQNGRLSAGAEAYFSPLNKSGGISTGLRFTTLPIHSGFPYTMTLTLNPLMGNLSSSYAVKAGPNLAFCSRFDFNVYSYESDVVVGMELWHRRQPSPDVGWATALLKPGWKRAEAEANGVLKAKVDNHGKVGLLWECKVKELLVSLGAGFDLKKRERMLSSVGVELSYAQNAAGETSSDNILSTFTYSDCLNTSINGQVDYGAGSLDSSIDCTVPRKSFLSLNTTTGLGAGCVVSVYSDQGCTQNETTVTAGTCVGLDSDGFLGVLLAYSVGGCEMRLNASFTSSLATSVVSTLSSSTLLAYATGASTPSAYLAPATTPSASTTSISSVDTSGPSTSSPSTMSTQAADTVSHGHDTNNGGSLASADRATIAGTVIGSVLGTAALIITVVFGLRARRWHDHQQHGDCSTSECRSKSPHGHVVR